jgi:hypothetical protein
MMMWTQTTAILELGRNVQEVPKRNISGVLHAGGSHESMPLRLIS